MGLYEQQKRERSRRLCYTVLILCTMAGTAALTVSWLLATGRFDPNRSHVNKVQAKAEMGRDFWNKMRDQYQSSTKLESFLWKTTFIFHTISI